MEKTSILDEISDLVFKHNLIKVIDSYKEVFEEPIENDARTLT